MVSMECLFLTRLEKQERFLSFGFSFDKTEKGLVEVPVIVLPRSPSTSDFGWVVVVPDVRPCPADSVLGFSDFEEIS